MRERNLKEKDGKEIRKETKRRDKGERLSENKDRKGKEGKDKETWE